MPGSAIRWRGSSQATGTGMLLGTPAFMAPEQVIGKPTDIDNRVDLWAVGASIFNLVSGQMVHEAETGPQLMVKLATQPPRALHEVLPDAPRAVAAVVDRALAFDKNQRWQTAIEMQDALRSACAQSFGDFTPRTILARLVATARPPAPRAAPASPSGVRQPAPAPYGTSGQAAPRVGTGVRAVTAASPISTSSGLYQDQPAVHAPPRKALVAVVAGCAALAGMGIVFALMHRSASSSPTGPAAIAASASSPASVASAATPPLRTEVAPSVALAAPIPLPAVEPVGPEPHSSTGVATRRPQPSGVAGRAAVSARDGGLTRESSAKGNCNPPYTLDQNGEKHFKPECF